MNATHGNVKTLFPGRVVTLPVEVGAGGSVELSTHGHPGPQVISRSKTTVDVGKTAQGKVKRLSPGNITTLSVGIGPGGAVMHASWPLGLSTMLSPPIVSVVAVESVLHGRVMTDPPRVAVEGRSTGVGAGVRQAS